VNAVSQHGREWHSIFWHALPISAFVLAIYYYWFGIADRYIVFLYYHNMGSLAPDTSPFGPITSSRYWMAGLVCGGMVLVLYTGATWVLGRVWRTYEPPAWWRVWMTAAAPLVVGIPLITMLANAPTLPLPHAARTTLAAIIGVGLAALPARMAARRPWDLALLSWDGLAMSGVIQGVSLLERGLAMTGRMHAWALFVLGVSIVGTVVLLLIMTWLRRWRNWTVPSCVELIVAGLCIAYLVWPLVHHLGFTDGYYYITNMDNFFSRQWGFQLLAWAVAGGIAVVVTRWRTHMTLQRSTVAASPRAPGPS
jgi:hypothetical protein